MNNYAFGFICLHGIRVTNKTLTLSIAFSFLPAPLSEAPTTLIFLFAVVPECRRSSSRLQHASSKLREASLTLAKARLGLLHPRRSSARAPSLPVASYEVGLTPC